MRTQPNAGRLMAALFLLYAFAAVAGAQPIPVDAIVARVNGDAVLLSQLREAALDQPGGWSADFGTDPESLAYRRALTQYVDETLLVQAARREELEVDEAAVAAEVDALLEALRRCIGGGPQLDDWLEENHMTLALLRDTLLERERRRQLATKLVARGVQVGAEDVAAFVERRRAAGEPAELVNLALVEVACDGTDATACFRRAVDVAREAAADPQAYLERTAPPGVRFERLGWLDPRGLRDELRRQVETMRPVQVSAPVIATGSGAAQVLILLGRRTSRDLAYAEAFAARREQLVRQLRESAHIQLFDLQGRPLTWSSRP